jgi:ribosomal protein L16 Arg81 hydroxylase
MKRYLLIVILFIFTGFSALSQDADNTDRGAGKLQQRMQEYIQKRLNLSRNEAGRFSPVFLRYIVDLRRTHREFVTDKPILQLRIAELRVKYRNEFRQIFDEQRANKVYEYQREFEDKVRNELRIRISENKANPRSRFR